MTVDLRISLKDGAPMNLRATGVPATRSTARTAAIPPAPMTNSRDLVQGSAS